MYCNNCGLKADPEDIFCSGCGNKIKKKSDTASSEHEIKAFKFATAAPGRSNYTIALLVSKISLFSLFSYYNRKIPANRRILKGIWIVALICILGTLLTAYSTFAIGSNESSDTNSPISNSPITNSQILHSISQDRIQTDKNIRRCEQIATEYASGHTYSKDDVYDCDNMAQDIWDMLKAKGINARIAVGNFKSAEDWRIANGTDTQKSSDDGHLGEIEVPGHTYTNMNVSNSKAIESFNHAWVLAEVSPGSWLAIECTGGYIVYSDENEKYYQGLTFSNPKNYRSFLSLYRDWKIKALDYETEKSYYNELVKPYDNASHSEQVVMRSGIEIAQRTLYEKEKAFLKTDSELNALLKYG
ncbi:zinc ribbon domain-containing protein [Methanosarcina acetivorans]|uniref:zinc ribbon domain-containing protein n=1 Tax=Methanosarcina acetivorans TaxID=2214 RepID=UPI00064E9501|nr:zinc ribbon domain-containing protein [Methanosarcina acetivorans]